MPDVPTRGGKRFAYLKWLAFLIAVLTFPGTSLAVTPKQDPTLSLTVSFGDRTAGSINITGLTVEGTAKVAKCLRGDLGCQEVETNDYGESEGYLWASCEDFTTFEKGVGRTLLPLGLITDALGPEDASALDLTVYRSDAPFFHLSRPQLHDNDTNPYLPVSSASFPLPLKGEDRYLEASYGWPPGEFTWRGGILAVVFLIPVLILLRAQRIALGVPAEQVRQAWFSYWKTFHLMVPGGWIAWLFAMEFIRMREGLTFLFHAPYDDVAFWTLLFLPAFFISAIAQVVSFRVYLRLRESETTVREMVRDLVTKLLTTLIPIGCIFGAVNTAFYAPLDAVPWVIAVLVFFISGRWMQGRGSNITPYALTRGELRDRVFELAHKAGVKLSQVYLLPSTHLQLANAMASHGNHVILTDYLVENLNRKEVDAVLAHELAHLKHRHPLKMSLLFVALIFLGSLIAPLLASILMAGIYLLPLSENITYSYLQNFDALPSFPISLVIAFILFHFVSRKNERAADAAAGALTRDPESMISGLMKISHLNLTPLRWSKAHELLLTHPSTMRRIEALAGHFGITKEELTRLTETSEDDGNFYSFPTSKELEKNVFTSLQKGAISQKNSLLVLFTIALGPLFALRLYTWIVPLGGGWTLYLAGVLITATLLLLLLNYSTLFGYLNLRVRLKDRFSQEGIDIHDEDIFIGFAPDAEPRAYEGHSIWDIGFLRLSRDRLTYLGDQAQFMLPRERIRTINLGKGHPSWHPISRILVRWQHSSGEERTFSILAYSDTSRKCDRVTCRLKEQIEKWLVDGEAAVISSLARSDLGDPPDDKVTSASPKAGIRPGSLLVIFLLTSSLSIWIGSLSGLHGYIGYVLFTVACGFLFLFLPTIRYREP